MTSPMIIKPMQPCDYVIDETYRRQVNNNLLNVDGSVNSELSSPDELALAAIANAVHTQALQLTPAQTELAVKWLKTWKLKDSSSLDSNEIRTTEAFSDKLNELKNTPEQLRLQRTAAGYATKSRIWGVAFAVMLALLAGLAVSGAGWVWCLFAAAIAIGTLVASERSLVRALMAAKDQDRRYLMQSFRAANTVTELLNAGICAYIPGVLHTGPNYDEQVAKAAMADECERLTDALYRDPEGHLDPYSFRDSTPRGYIIAPPS